MRFLPGQVVLRRYRRAGRYTWIQPMWVVRDDEAGLLLWHPVGSDYARLVDAEGRTLHDVALSDMREPRFAPLTWQRYDTLVLMRPGETHSVWWFFGGGRFAGWYVNLEDPYERRDGGVDTTDLVLDVCVEPDGRWRWKDEEEFAALTGNPIYFDETGAARIRAEGERLIELAEAGRYPFDGTHVDFRPDPSWSTLRLPPGWDTVSTPVL